MEPQSNPFSDALDQLLSLAQPRPDLITPGSQAPGVLNVPRPATFAGRVIFQGQKPAPATLLGMLPMSGAPDEESLAAPVATTSVGGIASSLKNLAQNLKGKFKTNVVTPTGEPQLLFHGTPQAFGEFDLKKANPGLFGKGIYLTDDPSVTTGYAGQQLQTQSTPNVRPAFVRIQKPFDVEGSYPASVLPKLKEAIDKNYTLNDLPYARDLTDEAKRGTIGDHILRRIPISKDGSVAGVNIMGALQSTLGANEISKVVQATGYDGITHIGGQLSGGKPHRVYVAFDPAQVVSAFDPSLQPQAVTGGTLLKGATKEFGSIEQSIINQAEKGRPLSRAGFRPSLTNIKTGETLIGSIGSSHADLYPKIPGHVDTRQYKHGFVPSTGQILMSDEVAYLLTGPPDRLKVAAEMLKSGMPLSTIEEAIKARQGVLPRSLLERKP